MKSSALSLLFCLPLLGCFQSDVSAGFKAEMDAGPISPDFNPPDPDAGVVDPTSPGAEQFAFRVLTSPVGGTYAPRNVGAIWVETADGRFVKTLSLWAKTRARYLRRFQAASGGDVTDATTSATLRSHQVHEVTWDLTDRNRKAVPAGAYRLVLELTDKNSSGASLEIPFELGKGAFEQTPSDTDQFSEMLLSLSE